MTHDELAEAVAYALANARQRYPTMDGSHNPLPSERNEAERLVGVIHDQVLEYHRKQLCDYLTKGNEQALHLYEQTGHPMWLGKSLAYSDLLDAIENGAL